jgi:preprotein translocase subunit YajC
MGKMLTLASTGHLAAPAATGGGNYTFLIVIVVLFGLFYFVMIRPQRNKQRQVQQMQSQIGPGQRIRTTAGMYATVTAIDGDDVTLEVAPGVNVHFMRRAIMDVIPDDTDEDETADDDTAEAAEPADASPVAESDTSAEAGTPADTETATAGKAGKPGAVEDGPAAG